VSSGQGDEIPAAPPTPASPGCYERRTVVGGGVAEDFNVTVMCAPYCARMSTPP
jgi:hypothetical protein